MGKRFIITPFLLGAFLSGPLDAAGGKIQVAAIFALTGRGASSNIRHLHGAELAVEEINRSGGILGRPIDLIVLDNESTAVGSAKAAREAVQKGVVAIVGASWSDHSLAIAPVAQAAGIPMITNYSTNPKVTEVGEFIFRVCYIDTFQAGIMARFARTNLKLERIAVLYESGNEYSGGLASFFSAEFTRLGGKIVASLPYLKDSLDYSEQLTKFKGSKPQAIYLPAYEKEAGLIIRQAYKMGIDFPFLGSDSWADTMPKYLGGPVKKGYDVKPWNPESPHPASRRFVENYQKRFGGGEPLLSGSALAYDAVMLLADAIRRARSVRPDRIRQSLAVTNDFTGVTGPIRFDAMRNPIKGAIINRYWNSVTPRYYLTVNP